MPTHTHLKFISCRYVKLSINDLKNFFTQRTTRENEMIYCFNLGGGYCWVGLLDRSIWIAIQFRGLDCDWQSQNWSLDLESQSSFFHFNPNPNKIKLFFIKLKFYVAYCIIKKSQATYRILIKKNVWLLNCELIKRSRWELYVSATK